MPDYAVQIPVDSIVLEGNLTIPVNTQAVVLFAHGSGSNRFSERNQLVAQTLSRSGLSTLLVDLLTPGEDKIDRQTQHLRFDIGLLALRLTAAIDWLANNPSTSNLRTGLYGASTGAAAAIVATVARPNRISAIVSRGGRVDLAGQALSQVRAPTMLIVGGNDQAVVRLNRDAFGVMRTLKAMEVIPGATHLFEEPGAMERVSTMTRDWFVQYLTGVQTIPEPEPDPNRWNPVR
jgi:putative phosphoribosyl transferase